jgi:hypothetical protein
MPAKPKTEKPERTFKDVVEKARETARLNAVEAFEEGIDANLSPKAIRDWLLQQLERDRQKIFDNLMGVDRRWSEIEVKREGLFTDVIKPLMAEQLRPLLEQELQPMIERVVKEQTPKLKTAVKKRILDVAEWRLKEAADKHMEVAMRNLAQTITDELLAEAQQ